MSDADKAAGADRLRALIEATAEEARKAPPEPEPERESTPEPRLQGEGGIASGPGLPWYASVRLAQLLGLIAFVALAVRLVPDRLADAADVPVARGLGIAAYHVVHRIEAARQATGRVPTTVAADWTAGTGVRYEPAGDFYRVRVAREGLELLYLPGTNPELLLKSPLVLTRRIDEEADDG